MTDDRPYIEVRFTGTTLTESEFSCNYGGFSGSNIIIDYGDGTIANHTGNYNYSNYSHTYSTNGTYTIKIYGATQLLDYCFDSCSGITNVIISDSVTSINGESFNSCSNLTNVVIPDSVTNIGYECFNKCSSLTTISIPDSVTSMGHYCFRSCSNLENVQLNWTSTNDIVTYNSNWLRDANSNLVFTIPHDTTSLYEAKGYPTAKLVEQSPPASSHELFSDVKTLFLNNKEVKSIVINEPNGAIIYEKTITLITTNLTIEVPALVYSDIFDVTGLLTDDNNNPISGASVKLYRDGSILEATETTNSNGEVTFHRSAPTSITTYTFQLVFDGDSSYSNSSSSVVTRNVNAETTILNLTSPLNNATYNEGETIPIAGTITTDDGERLSSENPLIVTVYDENNNRLTVLPIVNGAFSRNITAPSSVGNHSITVKFEGASTAPPLPDEAPSAPPLPDEEPQVPSAPDEEPQEPQLIYTPSEATRNYTVIPDSLTLTSNKNILSAFDGEVATLTATLNASDNANQTVTFKKGNTVLGTDVTDSNGEATYTYESEGIGDVTITAECMNLQGTYSIEDCNYYHTTEYSSENSLNISLPNQFKLEFDIKPTNRSSRSGGNNGYIRIGENSNSGVWVGQMTSGGYHGIILKPSSTATYCSTITNLDWNHIIVTFDDATVSYTCNNETVTSSASNLTKINGLLTTNYEHLKNIKVKPLSPNVLSLSSDKEILSYADEDSCTLTATLTNNNVGISGKTITFKDMYNEVLDTVQTDSNGEATYEYTSQGAGDVTITAECMSLTKTFAICDAWRYSTTEYTSTQNVNWSLPNGDFEIDFQCMPLSRSSCFPQIGIGTDTNNIIYIGQGQHTGETTIVYKCNGTNQEVLTGTHKSTLNDWNDYKYTVVNGTHTLEALGDTLTSTKSCVTLSKVVQIYNQNSKLKDILIKPLSPSVLSLSSDKEILSYANEDSCTLTATLTRNNVGISGKTITFKDMYNEVLDTVQTDSNGEATYEYFSRGDGDVTITAECMSLQETYTIYDWYRYDDCSTDKTSNYIKGSYTSLTFDTDHYVMSTSTDDVVGILNDVDNVQFEILLKHNNNVGGIQIRQDISTHANGAVALYNNANNTTYLALFPWSNIKSQNNVTNNSDYYRYILTINGSSVTARIENTSGVSLFSGTTSKSLSAKHFCIFNVGNNTLNIKEIVVKPLLTSSPPKVDKPEEPETDELE